MVNSIMGLWIAWAGITTVLVALIIYRSLVGMKEDDQLFLDAAEDKMQAEQQAIVHRLEKLRPLITSLALLSGLVLVVIAGIWVYRGIIGFNQ